MRIYRFEKNESCRIETIKNKQLYFSAPKKFNDLNDSRLDAIIHYEFDDTYLNTLNSCINLLYPDGDLNYFPLPQDIIEGLKNSLKECCSNPSLPAIVRQIKRNEIVFKIRTYLRETTGICCFFKGVPTSSLMWAHYANSHTGFCIEYEMLDSDYPIYPVNYVSQLPSPSINELLFCPQENFTKILTSKTIEWSYEKELRLVLLNELNQENEKGVGKLVDLPKSFKPTQIITGAKFEPIKGEISLHDLGIEITSHRNFISNTEY